jgi:hypothetical protein
MFILKMASYTYNVIINKPGAFTEYLTKNFTSFDYVNSNHNSADIFSKIVLSEPEITTLTTLVKAYVDPTEYLTLTSQFTDSSETKPCNSTDITTVKTFIHSASYQGDGVFNTFKMIFKYTADSLDSFSTDSSCIVTLQLFCETRQYLMKTITFDISSVIDEWKTMTGPYTKYKTVLLSDLRQNVTNYDVICSFKAKISSPSIFFSFHSLQSLYYNIE